MRQESSLRAKNSQVSSTEARRSEIVFDDRDRERFVDLLQEVVRRFGWIIHQFTLMTNHLHLVLSTPDPTLSRA